MTVQEFDTRIVQGREVCTVKAAAEVLGVSTVTITKYMERGIIGYIALPSGIRQPLADSVREHLAVNEDEEEA